MPPTEKNFEQKRGTKSRSVANQVWKEFTTIYCNTTDLGIYQLGENNDWIPIHKVMPVKNKITMDLDNIHLDTTGQIDLTANTLT
jgi:hypothetical protein